MEKGDKVRITRNLSSHRYQIGSIVTIESVIERSSCPIYKGAEKILGQSFVFTRVECELFKKTEYLNIDDFPVKQ